MINDEIMVALAPLITAFKDLKIDYYIGGSVASSNYGLPRSTLDIDLIADLDLPKVNPLVQSLKDLYYFDKNVIIKAIKRNSSFNIIHLASMIKLDIFLLKKHAYGQEAFARRLKDRLDEQEKKIEIFFAAPEDVILNKLDWYRQGGEVSERQWKDLIGVLKVQKETLDYPYLHYWSKQLKLAKLLKRALLMIE